MHKYSSYCFYPYTVSPVSRSTFFVSEDAGRAGFKDKLPRFCNESQIPDRQFLWNISDSPGLVLSLYAYSVSVMIVLSKLCFSWHPSINLIFTTISRSI